MIMGTILATALILLFFGAAMLLTQRRRRKAAAECGDRKEHRCHNCRCS